MITDKICKLVDDSLTSLDSILIDKLPPGISKETCINTIIKHVKILLNEVKEKLDFLEIANVFTQGKGEKSEKKPERITADKLANELDVSIRTIQRHCKKACIKKTAGVYLLTPGQAEKIWDKCNTSPRQLGKMTIRNVICECGNDTYKKTYENRKSIWVCVNCCKVTHRQIRDVSFLTWKKKYKKNHLGRPVK